MSSEGEILRHSRNFVVITIIIILCFTICFYITGILFSVVIIGDWDYITRYFSLPLHRQFVTLFQTIWEYWIYYFKNHQLLELSSQNYLILKLWTCTFAPVITLLIIAFMFRAPIMDFRPFKKEESIHGDARWAKAKEVKKMGLRKKNGCLLGKYGGKFLVTDDYQHILLFAPTGSGKGVGFVIPNLLFWNNSVIVFVVRI